MIHIFKRRRYSVAGALCLAATLFVTTGVLPVETAGSASALPQQDDTAQAVETSDSPRACIDPLMASHIAATLVSLLPLAGAQTIIFGSGVYVLEDAPETAADSAEDAASGDLDIDGDVTLRGIGAQKTTLHGNAVDRVLDVHGGVVRIVDLAIAGGDAGAGAEGGGIHNDGGDVRLVRVTVDGNSAVNGGAIMNTSGQMRVAQSSIVQNTAQGSGGGIMNQAKLTLENVTISGNQAAGGGGIAGVGGDAQLLYLTLPGNSASNAGGGINSTGNSVRVKNTLLAGNDAPIGPDCAPELVSGGHNLIGTLQDCRLSGSTGGNVTGQTPKIDGLTVNSA